jgi:Patatin-like phospholipase
MNNPAPPARYCDLVMKGGITSGVVYPKAAARLAESYTFKNIGGTSAGAIAAAMTAAAEYGRQGGSSKSFEMLAAVPEWLGTGSRLFNMFAPSPSTKALFALLTAPMGASSMIGKIFAVLGTVLRRFFSSVFIGVVVGAGIAYLAESTMGGTGRPWGDALAVLVGIIAFATVLFLQIKRQALHNLPENFYGLSKAFDPSSTSTEGPLVNWLSDFLDRLGGKDPAGPPLAFGDLLSRGVNLEVMTTALNHGRPYRLPFRDPDRVFYFSPVEFRTLFPERVVKQMVEHAPKREGIPPKGPAGRQMVAFSDAADLPVVVATRMSLSFPILIAAVPLYAVDFTRTMNQVEGEAPTAERCWFSDGGISSNMPIHFFDQAIPRWPTFAINLKDFHPDFQAEEDAVWLPMRNNSGWHALWTRFEAPGSFGSPVAFLGSMINVMQNWRDNTLSRVPGYRDRMVHVSQRSDEGGLNLSMPPDLVERLGKRGERAGELLIERFVQGTGWDNHQWVRFRSTLEVTTHWLGNITGAANPSLHAKINVGAPSYPVPPAFQTAFHHGANAILTAALTIAPDAAAMEANAPHPEPELAIRPKI